MPFESGYISLLLRNVMARHQLDCVMSKSILALVIGLFATMFGSLAVKASTTGENSVLPASERPLTTYERFLPLAVAGDPAIQHFLGYMFFYGEGVELNYEEAHYWFHQAAEEGDVRAQRNLGIFHARAIDRIPEKFYDAGEANLWFSLAAANPENPGISPLASKSYEKFLSSNDEKVNPATANQSLGEIIYHGSCAGCHGFSGLAAYPEAPSFARGDRLEQSDLELVASILHGKGTLPAWDETLSEATAYKILAYIRTVFGHKVVQEIPPASAGARPGNGQVALGDQIYLRFCGGCHGFNGIAWYVNSPSFALRDCMNKSDADLANSIINGRGAMPSWEYMLKPDQIDALVKFVRTLAPTYEAGISGGLRRPERFLRFRPKSETRSDWTADDLR